jgi:hypothetical protein
VNILSKTSFNTLRSSVFLAVFVVLYQSQICGHRNLVKSGWVQGNNKYLYWLFGVTCSGAAIMVEQESRRAELAMYVLPKAAESLYKILYQKNWIKAVKHWEVMTFSFAMSLIMVSRTSTRQQMSLQEDGSLTFSHILLFDSPSTSKRNKFCRHSSPS